jgi:hypothetical protein
MAMSEQIRSQKVAEFVMTGGLGVRQRVGYRQSKGDGEQGDCQDRCPLPMAHSAKHAVNADSQAGLKLAFQGDGLRNCRLHL